MNIHDIFQRMAEDAPAILLLFLSFLGLLYDILGYSSLVRSVVFFEVECRANAARDSFTLDIHGNYFLLISTRCYNGA